MRNSKAAKCELYYSEGPLYHHLELSVVYLREEISQTDWLQLWHPVTVPELNLVSA